jgi:uncharacterized cupredoxin-like copper-binding protein
MDFGVRRRARANAARRTAQGAALLAVSVLLGALAQGCSSTGSSTVHRPVVQVNERDFRIFGQSRRVRPGDVSLRVHNSGPDVHELIVVRSDGARLPLRHDGLTVDEEALKPATAGTLEPAEPGIRDLHVNLRAGRYVLICNMSGHYLSGMKTDLVVQ